jgi:DNA-binding PadR family transcriptional regulator
MVAATVGHFWALPHSQLYDEPTRLARAGYLTENQQPDGRRRKLYTLTDRGRDALKDWLEVRTPELYELRDLALLKLFLGANARQLAEAQLETHKQRLLEYEALHDQLTPEAPLAPGRHWTSASATSARRSISGKNKRGPAKRSRPPGHLSVDVAPAGGSSRAARWRRCEPRRFGTTAARAACAAALR